MQRASICLTVLLHWSNFIEDLELLIQIWWLLGFLSLSVFFMIQFWWARAKLALVFSSPLCLTATRAYYERDKVKILCFSPRFKKLYVQINCLYHEKKRWVESWVLYDPKWLKRHHTFLALGLRQELKRLRSLSLFATADCTLMYLDMLYFLQLATTDNTSVYCLAKLAHCSWLDHGADYWLSVGQFWQLQPL